MLCAILAWTTFAFGGVYPGGLAVSALACAALALAYRADIGRRGPHPELDRLLILVLLAGMLQLVPIPRAILAWLSPAAERVWRSLTLVDAGAPLPLSIDLEKSAAAALLYGLAIALFFTAREIFSRGGIRLAARAVALIGFALAGVAIAQDATGDGRMYWKWWPVDEGPRPFGPFVNRNHFGTWAVLAVPLCIGYLWTHAVAHHGPGPDATWQRRLKAALDGRAAMLLAASTLLILATVVSLSRSSMAALLSAAIAGAVLTRGRAPHAMERSSRPVLLLIGAMALAGIAVASSVDRETLTIRLSATGVAAADRLTIWRDTLAVIRDFWLTGTGLGTYQTSMAIYQRSSPGVLFNQAHNHYLQVVSEGGLLVAVPVLLAVAAFARTALRSLREDRSGMFWVRAGAASGLFGVAVQSLFETGLRTPANTVLAVLLAAIATHPPAHGRQH